MNKSQVQSNKTAIKWIKQTKIWSKPSENNKNYTIKHYNIKIVIKLMKSIKHSEIHRDRKIEEDKRWDEMMKYVKLQ